MERVIVLDGKTNSVSFYINLTSDIPVQKLVLDPTDLVSGDQTIDRSNVRLAQESSLPAKIPTNVLVTVSGLVRQGVYEGAFVLRAADRLAAKGNQIKLKLTVHAKPTLSFVPTPVTWSAFACDLPLSCWIGQHTTSVPAAQTVGIDNQTPTDVRITAKSVELRGEKTGQFITTDGSGLDTSAATLTANKMAIINAHVKNQGLQPDKYQGPLRVTAEYLDAPLTTTVTLNVRDGPLCALVLIILGVVIGRLSQKFNSDQFKKREDELRLLQFLQHTGSSLSRSDSRLIVMRAVEDINLRIRLKSASTDIDARLDQLREKIELLTQVEARQEEAQDTTVQTLIEQVNKLANNAVASIQNGVPSDAQQRIREMEQLINQAATSTRHLAAKQSLALPTIAARPVPIAEKILLTISGTDPVDESHKMWRFLKPALFLIVLVSLVLIGLFTLYVKNSTFGSDWLFDYLGVFIWGLSADIAQRGLQNLPRLG